MESISILHTSFVASSASKIKIDKQNTWVKTKITASLKKRVLHGIGEENLFINCSLSSRSQCDESMTLGWSVPACGNCSYFPVEVQFLRVYYGFLDVVAEVSMCVPSD